MSLHTPFFSLITNSKFAVNVGLVLSKDTLGCKIPKAAMGKTISECQKAGVSQCKAAAFERGVAKGRQNKVSDGVVVNLLFGSVMVKGKSFFNNGYTRKKSTLCIHVILQS